MEEFHKIKGTLTGDSYTKYKATKQELIARIKALPSFENLPDLELSVSNKLSSIIREVETQKAAGIKGGKLDVKGTEDLLVLDWADKWLPKTPKGAVEPTMAPGTTVQTGLPGMGIESAQTRMFEEAGKAGAKPIPLIDAEAIKAREAAKPLPGQLGLEKRPSVRTPEQVTTEYEDVGQRQAELQVRLESIQDVLRSDPIAKYTGKVGMRTTRLTQILRGRDFPETVTVKEAQMLMQGDIPKASAIV